MFPLAWPTARTGKRGNWAAAAESFPLGEGQRKRRKGQGSDWRRGVIDEPATVDADGCLSLRVDHGCTNRRDFFLVPDLAEKT